MPGITEQIEKIKEKLRTPAERKIAHHRRYEEICDTLKTYIPEWKKEIEKKEKITMPYTEFTAKMGPAATKWHPTASYWDAKKCLMNEGILFGKTKKDHEEQALMIAMKPEYEVKMPGGPKMIQWPAVG